MILTDYYKAEKLPESKSKLRYDVTASTGHYEPFEALKNKKNELFFYYGDVPDNFNSLVKRKADKCITKTKNISSVFVPDITLPFAYGDVNSTSDALIILFNENYTTIEIFVARGQRNNKRNLYFLLTDGELQNEIEMLRKKANELPK
ncbi:MAG: hypothetical protein WCH34_01290 [Bacteroidota bacterium]